MSTAELLKELTHMSNADRLLVIETATRLVRNELAVEGSDLREERNRKLRAAAVEAKEFYRPGGELTEWTALDAEEFVDDYP